MRTLYLCYFGIDQPLVQTQVLPYLRELRGRGIEPALLTFEPETGTRWRRERAATWADTLSGEGIQWSWIRYHRRPTLPATSFDIMTGTGRAIRLVRRHGCEILHARGHVAAAIGVLAKRATGARLLFDVRGFLPEEYVDGGIWQPGGLPYRITKRAERHLFQAADGFVVLTERARDALFPGSGDADRRGRPIEVIPCCVDLDRFTMVDAAGRARAKSALGIDGRRVFVHAGALDGWIATELIAAFIAAASSRDPRAFTLLLTHSNSDRLTTELRRLRVAEDRFAIASVPAGDVPRYLHAADVGLAIYKAGGSKAASSPTKIAEYLASGIPVVHTAGIGNVDEVLDRHCVGVRVGEADPGSLDAALSQLDELCRDPDLQRRCRQCAEEEFDLHLVGGARYRRIYARLIAGEAR